MRQIIITLAFAALSACVGSDATPPPGDDSQIEQGICSDTWECWCNTFSTSDACNAASTSNGWRCYWAGPLAQAPALDATSQPVRSLNRGLCHATHE